MLSFSNKKCGEYLRAISCGALCFTSVLAGPANASDALYAELRQHWQARYGQKIAPKDLDTRVERLFDSLDLHHDGIDQNDINLFVKRELARTRAQVFHEYLRFDLNADQSIERDETEVVMRSELGSRAGRHPARVERTIQRSLKKLFDHDPNQDGTISFSELTIIAEKKNGKRPRQEAELVLILKSLLELDPDKNGRLELVEARDTLRKAFTADTYASALQMQAPSDTACTAPEASAESDILLVGSYEGSSVPSVTVAGQDAETSTGTIRIEPGEKGLYLVLVSYTPMIWQFEGATDRIEHVVLAGRTSKAGKIKAGLTGVAPSKSSFLPAEDCITYFWETGALKEVKARIGVTSLAGKAPTTSFGQYTLHDLSLPSGSTRKIKLPPPPERETRIPVKTVSASKKTFEPSKAINSLMSQTVPDAVFYPIYIYNRGGVISLDREEIVSDAPAEDYIVLPQETGLAQLVAERKLKLLRRGQFRIVDEIRIPASLAGAHRVDFILSQGVEVPKGDPGHSCVLSEDAGGYIINKSCE